MKGSPVGRVTDDRLQTEGGSYDDLLRRIALGDQQAFRLLMQRHSRPMLILAQRVTGNEHDADEIVQEAFLKVWRLAEKWKSDGAASFSTWFYRIVLNACLDRKRRAPMAPLDEAGDPADPALLAWQQAEVTERRKYLLEALEDLPERQKSAICLCYFGEITAQEAAKIMQMSLSALEALLLRGRRSLRKSLIKRGFTSLGDIL